MINDVPIHVWFVPIPPKAAYSPVLQGGVRSGRRTRGRFNVLRFKRLKPRAGKPVKTGWESVLHFHPALKDGAMCRFAVRAEPSNPVQLYSVHFIRVMEKTSSFTDPSFCFRAR